MSRWRRWWIAARPHTLWAAVVPVLVGGGLAWGDRSGGVWAVTVGEEMISRVQVGGERAFRLDVFLVTLIAAIAMQVAANFANDVSDARRGADTPDRLGPTRVVAAGLLSPAQVWRATWAAFAVSALGGVYLAAVSGWVVLAVGALSIVSALGYVGGPRPYGYLGLGELFVFVFFGLVATVMSRYVHDRSAPLAAWLLAVPVGLAVTSILVANNIRDIETDAAAGKRTLAVILGRSGAVALYGGLWLAAFAAVGLFAAIGATPVWTALALVAAPAAVSLTRAVARRRDGPGQIAALKGTARLHLAMGVLLAAGAMAG